MLALSKVIGYLHYGIISHIAAGLQCPEHVNLAMRMMRSDSAKRAPLQVYSPAVPRNIKSRRAVFEVFSSAESDYLAAVRELIDGCFRPLEDIAATARARRGSREACGEAGVMARALEVIHYVQSEKVLTAMPDIATVRSAGDEDLDRMALHMLASMREALPLMALAYPTAATHCMFILKLSQPAATKEAKTFMKRMLGTPVTSKMKQNATRFIPSRTNKIVYFDHARFIASRVMGYHLLCNEILKCGFSDQVQVAAEDFIALTRLITECMNDSARTQARA